MAAQEKIDTVVLDAFRRIHYELGHEWAYSDDVARAAQEITATNGMGETKLYRVGAAALHLFGRRPGPLLERIRFERFESGHLSPSLQRLKDKDLLDERWEPREPPRGRTRQRQYSLAEYLPPPKLD